MIVCKRQDITAIHGDIIEAYFVLENVDLDAVKSVYFSCKNHDISFECPYSDIEKGYCLRLASDITSLLKPSFSQFDLTIELIDGNVVTAIHGGNFTILKKRNTVVKEE